VEFVGLLPAYSTEDMGKRRKVGRPLDIRPKYLASISKPAKQKKSWYSGMEPTEYPMPRPNTNIQTNRKRNWKYANTHDIFASLKFESHAIHNELGVHPTPILLLVS
jgi:hypothetical protein